MEGNPQESSPTPAAAARQDLLLFGKYGVSDVVVKDAGLAKYINLDPTVVPHTDGRHSGRWFGKARLNIVERLINNMMRTEVFTGKKMKAYRTTQEAFDIVAKKTDRKSTRLNSSHPQLSRMPSSA